MCLKKKFNFFKDIYKNSFYVSYLMIMGFNWSTLSNLLNMAMYRVVYWYLSRYNNIIYQWWQLSLFLKQASGSPEKLPITLLCKHTKNLQRMSRKLVVELQQFGLLYEDIFFPVNQNHLYLRQVFVNKIRKMCPWLGALCGI